MSYLKWNIQGKKKTGVGSGGMNSIRDLWTTWSRTHRPGEVLPEGKVHTNDLKEQCLTFFQNRWTHHTNYNKSQATPNTRSKAYTQMCYSKLLTITDSKRSSEWGKGHVLKSQRTKTGLLSGTAHSKTMKQCHWSFLTWNSIPSKNIFQKWRWFFFKNAMTVQNHNWSGFTKNKEPRVKQKHSRQRFIRPSPDLY